jgi:hypothetical protein
MCDNLVKSRREDGFVKSSRCKARKTRGVKRTTRYAATTKVKRNAADGLFTKPSNVQIGHAQGVFLDKFAPWFYLVI